MTRKQIWIAAGVVILVSLLWAGPALAHALLVRSIPESNAELQNSPGSVEMWFSEPIEPAFSDARLVGPDGQDVDTGAAIVDDSDPTHMTLVLGNLDPGLYTVAWHTLSVVDGHDWYGSFPFTVLNPDGTRPAAGQAISVSGGRGDLPSPGETAARWLALVPAMLIFGGTLVQLVVVGGVEDPQLRQRARANLARVIWLAAIAVVVGTVLQLVLQAQRLGGLGSLAKLTLNTRTGLLGTVRVLLVTILALAACELDRDSRAAAVLRLALPLAGYLIVIPLAANVESIQAALWLIGSVAALLPLAIFKRRDPERPAYRSLAIGALVLLFSFASSSHAGAAQGSLYAVAADFVHLIAASSWFSGITLLTLLWLQTHRTKPGAAYLEAVKRFSTLAGAAVLVIVLSGTFSSLVELPTLSALWSTAYGRVLLVKLGLVGLAFLIAFTNNLRVRRWQGTEQLPRSIAFEAGAAVGILLVVAILVQTPTPRSLATDQQASVVSIPFNKVTPTDDLQVHIQVDPNQAGQNRFWVHLYHSDGSEIGEVQLVRLFFENLDRQLGRASVDLPSLGQDTFAADGSYLSQPGRWQIQTYVRRRGFDDLLSSLELEVAPPPSSTAAASPLSNPAPGVPPLTLIGGLVLALGAVPFLWPKLLVRRFPRLLPAGGAVLIAIGIFGVVRGLTSAGANQIPLVRQTNPVPPTAESIARGNEIYSKSCVMCHGSSGKGDGPVGVTLSPRPSNFEIHMPPGIHTDGQLMEWISNGFPDTAMPAFGDGYTEDQLWDVINYIRTFAPDQGT